MSGARPGADACSHGVGPVEPDTRVELRGERGLGIVTRYFGFRTVDHANEALESQHRKRFAKRLVSGPYRALARRLMADASKLSVRESRTSLIFMVPYAAHRPAARARRARRGPAM